MAFWSRLLARPMTQDRFARLLMKRVRQSGDTRPVEYVREGFELRRQDGGRMFLGNLYAQYQRSEKEQHEGLIRSFLTTWHTAGFETPDDFDDVRADLMPALRSRMYLVNTDEMFRESGQDSDTPCQIIGEHLAVTLVYDLPQSMMTVNGEQLDTWGVTFYEAMEVAKRNLTETTTQYAQLGSMYALAVGDAYDATRLLLTDTIEQMEVEGATIAAVPNRERLYVCGSEDEEGLLMLSKAVEEDLNHERSITGVLFRLEHGEWEPWLPPEDHPAHDAWRLLAMQSHGQDYAEQKALLDKRHEKEKADVFLASFAAMEDEATGSVSSWCSWTEGVETWLPETDEVIFTTIHGADDVKLRARAAWDEVRAAVGDLMEPLDLYPPRWRVTEFPSDDALARLGGAPE